LHRHNIHHVLEMNERAHRSSINITYRENQLDDLVSTPLAHLWMRRVYASAF